MLFGGSLGLLGRSLGGAWAAILGPWGCLGGAYEAIGRITKTLKNHWFFLCFQLWEGPGGALEGPCGAAVRPGGPFGAIGEAPRGSLGVFGGVGGLQERILGGFVITWGGLLGGFGGSGEKPGGYDPHLQ